MVRTQVQLTKIQLESLRQLSAETGRSVADLVREGIDQFVARRHGASREAQVDRARKVAGKFRSGGHDISSSHDQYFAEAI